MASRRCPCPMASPMEPVFGLPPYTGSGQGAAEWPLPVSLSAWEVEGWTKS